MINLRVLVKEIHLRLQGVNHCYSLINSDRVFSGDLFNLSPFRGELFSSGTSLISRRLNLYMCSFDNEVSVIRAFNFSVVFPNAVFQAIDSISQLDYLVLIIVVLFDESIPVNLSALS